MTACMYNLSARGIEVKGHPHPSLHSNGQRSPPPKSTFQCPNTFVVVSVCGALVDVVAINPTVSDLIMSPVGIMISKLHQIVMFGS